MIDRKVIVETIAAMQESLHRILHLLDAAGYFEEQDPSTKKDAEIIHLDLKKKAGNRTAPQ